MEGIKSGKFYKENNKIYRVFRTVIEMVKDRGFYVPLGYMNLYNNYTNFVWEFSLPKTGEPLPEVNPTSSPVEQQFARQKQLNGRHSLPNSSHFQTLRRPIPDRAHLRRRVEPPQR